MGGILGISSPTFAAEISSEKSSEYLWSISKMHLQDPLKWSSIWKTKPQSQDPADMQRWKGVEKESPLEKPNQPMAPAPKKPDWRLSEEKRTHAYLNKVEAFQEKGVEAMPPDEPIAQTIEAASSNGDVTEGKHYLSQSVVLTTPFLGEISDEGGIFPGECKIRYNSNNESNILQLFDEVALTSGSEKGVKVGDFFRSYEVGPTYRSFTAGRPLGRLVETNGLFEIVRVGPKSSVGRLVKCFGTISADSRACPLATPEEISTSGYTPVTDGKAMAQVIWVTQQEQFPQPFSYAIVDKGSAKGLKLGDMVLFYNRTGGKMSDKVLGNGLVVGVQEKSATVLIKDLYPGIINRGDYTVTVQSTMM